MKLEICEFFKGLLDPEIKDLKDEFFDIFYARILPIFIDFLISSNDMFTVSLVLELLTLCGAFHGYRISHYFIHNGVLKKLMPLFSSKNKALRLAMIRLSKALISQKDENFNKYLAKHDLLSPIFKYLEENKRDNMILAACFDLLNTAAVNNMHKLLAYFMTKYESLIVEGTYARNPVMKKIKLKYELFTHSDKNFRKDNFLPRRMSEEGRRVNIPIKEITQKRALPEMNSEEKTEEAINKKKKNEDEL